MVARRWSQEPNTGRIHPDAIETSRELERRGYTQHEPDDLKDEEGVVVVSAADGSHGPARFHRRGLPGAHGKRDRDVFEAWPDSPFSEHLPYGESHHEANGSKFSRLGVFRMNHPDHMQDIISLYDGRARRHQEEAGGPA